MGLTQDEAMIGESAVRLGDQARVQRALDKYINMRMCPVKKGNALTHEPRPCINNSQGTAAFTVVLATRFVGQDEAERYLRECFVDFLEEVLRG